MLKRYRWNGQALAQVRAAAGLTQVELARRAGLYQTKLSRLELHHPPSLVELAQLADALELAHGELFARCVDAFTVDPTGEKLARKFKKGPRSLRPRNA